MSLDQVRGWFSLTRKEQCFIAGIAALFLLGLVARYVYLRGERPETVEVEELYERSNGAGVPPARERFGGTSR